MNISQENKVKKVFLYSLITSVVLSALLGSIAILRGDMGWVEVRIFFTTLTISAASICGLACGAYLATKRGKNLPLAGICLALISGLLLVAGMWLNPRMEAYWKLAASLSVFAAAFAHLSLLSMARLARRFRWTPAVAYIFILGVAAISVFIILSEPRGNDWIWRLLVVMANGDAAITLLTPIFHWMSRDEVRDTTRNADSIDEEIARLKARIVELEMEKQRIS
jgi:hypothetical protein